MVGVSTLIMSGHRQVYQIRVDIHMTHYSDVTRQVQVNKVRRIGQLNFEMGELVVARVGQRIKERSTTTTDPSAPDLHDSGFLVFRIILAAQNSAHLFKLWNETKRASSVMDQTSVWNLLSHR